MKLDTPAARAATIGAAALAALGSAAWVEHRARLAQRRHHAPHRLMYVNGVRLHYQLVGEGPAVLLVHGNLVHGADFEASGLLDRLAMKHQVLVIDRPGFGHSDRPRDRPWTPAMQARLLHQAVSTLGLQRVVVVGHSLGAQVALAMALQNPASVDGLVLVGGYYWPRLRLDRWLAAPAAMPVLGDVLRYTTSAWTARATLGPAVRSMFHPHPVPERFHELLPREMLLRPLQQRAAAEDATHLVAQARALVKQYASLQMPVTLIAGAKDGIVSAKQSRWLHAGLPHSRLHILDGVGHMAHYQAHDTIEAGVQRALANSHGTMVRPEPAELPRRSSTSPLPRTPSTSPEPLPTGGR
jgi:pimeloyl-ACP methyl ester carboxylesterase